MKRYSAYKPSGVEWIGDIPEKWKIMPFKYCMTINNGADYKDIEDSDGYPVFGSGGSFAFAKKYMYDGEVVFLGRKGTVDKPLYYNGKFWAIDTMFYAIPQRNVSCKYMYYHALTFPFDFYLTDTARPSMTQTDLGDNKIAVPPKDEQVAIAAYLDSKCAKIDNVLSVQQKRIELLKELKQSIITNAVTKGLDKNVEFKPSGIEWIGDIPEKWKIKRMRFLCKMNTGDKDTVNREDDGLYPFYVRSPNVERINSYTFDGEAVLMAGDGVGAGKVIHYANGKFDYHQRVYNFHEYKEILTKYAYYYLVSNFRYKIEEGGAKNTVDSVRLPWLKDFPICFPTIKEQEKILSYIERKSTAIDNQISKIERQIELLKEYKQSIITECVTGKRKVC